VVESGGQATDFQAEIGPSLRKQGSKSVELDEDNAEEKTESTKQ